MRGSEDSEQILGGQALLTDDSSDSTTNSTNSRRRVSLTRSIVPQSPREDDPFSLQSPTYESPAAFENNDFEFLIRWYRRVWSIVLGFTGVLDILAYLEPTLHQRYDEMCTVETDFTELGESLTTMILGEVGPRPPWYCSTWAIFLGRLRDYNIVIAFSFSLLWFLHSHSKAREAYYYKFSVQEDRMHLSARDDEQLEGKLKGWTRKRLKKYNANRAFYRRILSRMLLLPVGFYITIYHLLRGLLNGQWLYQELLIRPANETEVFATIIDPSDYVQIEITESHAKMSTVFTIFLYLKYHFFLATSLARTEVLKTHIPRFKRRLVGNAVRNPRNFLRKFRKYMRYIRWTKYMIPLVLKLNKLRANTVSTIKKRRQYSLTQKQRKKISKLRISIEKTKPRGIREKNAAMLIQHVWRSYRKQKIRRVAVHFIKDKRINAAMKIQTAYRRMALKTRIKNSRNMRELYLLEQLKRKASKHLDDEDRKRLYQLQDEFVTEAKKTINKRLLLRPNTRLMVLWNFLFVFCVILEMSHTALRPWLLIPKAKQVDGKKYRSQRVFLAEYLTPMKVAETEACKDVFKKKPALHRLFFHSRHEDQPTKQEVLEAFVDEIIDPDSDWDDLGGYAYGNYTTPVDTKKEKIKWRCREPISTWRDGFRDLVALTLRPDPVSGWSECQPKEASLVGKILSPVRKIKVQPPPWYCTKPYSVVQDAYRRTWNFVVDQILGIIAVICFFDVFVKFFTGEFDPMTGELKPKPFFRRWIIPGLLLQLLVNPAIYTFSTWFFAITDWIMVVGPVRVLRWFIAVVVPMGYGSRNLVLHALYETESDQQLDRYRMKLLEYPPLPKLT